MKVIVCAVVCTVHSGVPCSNPATPVPGHVQADSE